MHACSFVSFSLSPLSFAQLPHGTGSVPSSPLHSVMGHLDSPGDGLTLASFLRDPGPILNKASKRLHSISEEVSDRDDIEEGGETNESEINMELEGGQEMSQQGADNHPGEVLHVSLEREVTLLQF